jgi:hypothetical protein
MTCKASFSSIFSKEKESKGHCSRMFKEFLRFWVDLKTLKTLGA